MQGFPDLGLASNFPRTVMQTHLFIHVKQAFIQASLPTALPPSLGKTPGFHHIFQSSLSSMKCLATSGLDANVNCQPKSEKVPLLGK